MDELYIGLMSGTSIDAVDAVLVDFSKHQSFILQTYAEPLPDKLRTQLQNLIEQQQTSLSNLAELDHELAVIYTLAVKKVLLLASVGANRVVAIGSHGQTIYHNSEREHANSLQIGDPNFLAEHTGIDVVADFRRHDMAVGGQGAPLVPAFHAHVFRNKDINRVILNLGGIANITVLPADTNAVVSGFDTGPANTLLDRWASQHLATAYDQKGNWARQGKTIDSLLTDMLADPYFAMQPPKSTGREYFNLAWLEQFKVEDYDAVDVQATLNELTCVTIANAIKNYGRGTQELYVCGGGVHNTFLIERLKTNLSSVKVESTEVLGLQPDWIEATAFAWLARQTVLNHSGNIMSVTGAKRNVVLGGRYKSD